MKAQMKQTTNGVEVTRLVETIEAVKAQPELAKFRFRIANRWMGGAENRSEVQDFYGCSQEINLASSHLVEFQYLQALQFQKYKDNSRQNHEEPCPLI